MLMAASWCLATSKTFSWAIEICRLLINQQTVAYATGSITPASNYILHATDGGQTTILNAML